MRNVIEKLKNIKGFRKTGKKLKKAGKFFVDIQKRSPTFFFHSPDIAIANARQPFIPDDIINEKIKALENNLVEGLSIYKDVISYPVTTGREREFAGGLVDNKTHKLLEEGIHLGDKGQLTQELPGPDDVLIPGADPPEIRQMVLFGGIVFNHFGHFLLESLGRLWAYDYVKDLDPYILFYSDSEIPKYLENENFIHQVLSGFNIPLKRVLFINYTVKINQVIIPVQKYGYRLRNNPDDIFLKFMAGFRFPRAVPDVFKNAGRIYVSRSRMAIGRVIGENHFEDYLRDEGFAVLHPELYSIYQQLAIYNIAGKIIFCDGAAIHTCVLLPALKADIAVISRRRDPRWSSRNIIDQFDGYHKKVLWIDCLKDQYQFGRESWHALSVVDWFEVSVQLKNDGFVNNLNTLYHELDLSSLVRSELRKYIANILDSKEYSDFMIRLKEPLPAKE
ncbi:MAG: glycosyltransferase 61 family protein [Chitinophagaceae bacterium]